jgi:outer membrane receptor protein involved in Fe transport
MNSLATNSRHQSSKNDAGTFNFRHSALALALAGAMIAPNMVYAADDKTIAELQAEVARVNAENALLRQQLESSKSSSSAPQVAAPSAPAVTAAIPPATNAVSKEVKADEPVTLEAVVVHSRNRIEKLQDVPVSESVVTGSELERTATTDIGAITQRAGNVEWNYGNQRTSSLSIRGIGKQGQTEAQDPGVGLVVDGVSYAYNALSSSYDFTDVDTVEVARGPQGTLLGKNASYGSVIVNSKRPSFVPTTDFSLTVGQLGTVKATAAVGGPIIDDLLAWRGTFSASKAKGNLTSTTNQDLTYTNTDRLTGRAQFLLTPSDTFNALFAFNVTPRAGEFTNGDTIYTPTPATYTNGTSTTGGSADIVGKLSRSWFTNSGFNPSSYLYGGGSAGAVGYSVTSLDARPLVTGSNGAQAQLNWKLSGDRTLSSITAVENYYFDAVNDSNLPFDIYRNSGGFRNDFKQFSQELRLSSAQGGKVDYQTGLYYIHVRNLNDYQKAFGNDAGAYLANTAQYNALKVSPAGLLLMQNSVANLTINANSPAGNQDIRNTSVAAYGQANWHLSEPLTLTTGARITHERRDNTASSTTNNPGNGAALDGFSTTSTGALVANTTAAQTLIANSVAQQYFGVATYSGLASVAGAQQQVAYAQAIRKAAIGVQFQQADATPFSAIQPSFVVSPTYKVNENLTTYVSLQYGQKAGVSQFTNGISNPVRAERTSSYEAGFKSKLTDALVFNTAIFVMDVKDYQQSVSVVDPYTTALKADGSTYYTTATGNVPWVRAEGLEIDGVYSGIRNTSLRFSGAYNDAFYKVFTHSAQPVEYAGAAPYRDVSGQALPGASKWTGNVGGDYHKPLANSNVFHASFNTSFRTRYNSDTSLSSYAWVGGNSITDIAIGEGKQNKSFDANIVVKNVFNNQTPLARTWNTYTPAVQRWFGVVLSAKY